MKANLPETQNPRIVIVGGGFAGLKLARSLALKKFQVVLIDKNNFHQFQPLFYQVATAGLEPSSIAFPFRKMFQNIKNVHFRMGMVNHINHQEKFLETSFGKVNFDKLVLATGADTNFFGNANIAKYALPMKSVSEALSIRNAILQNYERALSEDYPEKIQSLLNIVVVGGGPTGVEVSGTLAEMKRIILPKDYPELNFDSMNIYLVEASPKVLGTMSEVSSTKSKSYLENLGVKVMLNTFVTNYNGDVVEFQNGEKIETKTLIWAAGIIGNMIKGLPEDLWVRGGRLKVNALNEALPNIYALGDLAYMEEDKKFPTGHPQVAQVAMQQAQNLAKNLINNKAKPFQYKDLGSMATVGRNLAVVELPIKKFQGFLAWIFWMLVHLMQIVGVKNKVFIFINWFWNYVTYDQSLRLILKPKTKENV